MLDLTTAEAEAKRISDMLRQATGIRAEATRARAQLQRVCPHAWESNWDGETWTWRECAICKKSEDRRGD